MGTELQLDDAIQTMVQNWLEKNHLCVRPHCDQKATRIIIVGDEIKPVCTWDMEHHLNDHTQCEMCLTHFEV